MAAVNEAGQLLLLGEAKEYDEMGLVENVGVTFTLMSETETVRWSKLTSGDGDDKLNQAVALPDGWVAAGATSSSNLSDNWHLGIYDGKETKSDAWVIRLDVDGEVVWSQTYGGRDWDTFYAICPAGGGGWVAAGNTYSSDGDVAGWHDSGEMFIQPDGWVVYVDVDGKMLWQSTLGGTGYDSLHAIRVVPGGYLAVGETDSKDGDVTDGLGGRDAWVVMLDEDGNLLWQACYGGKDDDAFVALSEGGAGWLAVGTSWSFAADDPRESCWAVLLDETGAIQWTQRFGGEGIRYPKRAVFSEDYWTIAGETSAEEKPREWLVAIPEWGGEWKLYRGTL